MVVMPETVVFVTGKKHKFEEVKSVLGNTVPFELLHKNIDLPELQGEVIDVCKKKCLEAAKIVRCPVIVEDTCLCFKALGDLPGPYIKWFADTIGPDGLYRLLKGWEDKSATAVCTIAYTDGEGGEILIFQGKTEGEIVTPRGPKDFGWDACFLPKGYEVTYDEMPKEQKNAISFRSKAAVAMRQYFAFK